jgi:hypothetical protein
MMFMKLEELFSHTFKALREQIDSEAMKKQVDFLLPSMPMVEACRADEFDFFQPWIDLGKLTVGQMYRAAERYFLGKSKSGASIFWMIDELCQPIDALIDPDTWMSSLLKKREPLLKYWRPTQCLFGEHLLCHTDLKDLTDLCCSRSKFAGQKISIRSVGSVCPSKTATSAIPAGELKPVCVVESPVSAVILSELYPNSIWLSTVPNSYFTIDLLEPLRGRTVKVYPHTDATLSNYPAWLDIADMARQAYHLDITVSHTLEDATSPSQKEREIDILQYLYELYSLRKVP